MDTDWRGAATNNTNYYYKSANPLEETPFFFDSIFYDSCLTSYDIMMKNSYF